MQISKNKRQTMKKISGGAFAQDEEDQLRQMGFTNEEIDTLNNSNISLDIVNQAIEYYHNNSFHIIVGIAQQLNENAMQNNNEQNNNEEPFLNIDDLAGQAADNELDNIPHAANDVHNLDDSGNTSIADESFNDFEGGKKRRRTKQKKTNLKRKRTHKKMKGGNCYGRGYGANANDPNLSIYNTQLTTLFPYKPSR